MSQLLYLNELAPWEEKNQYHEIVKLGTDVSKQTQILKEATKAQIKTQIASTNALIASQDRISNILNSGFEELSLGLSEISEGIYGLKSAFEWGISEVVWQIEQNRKELKSILDVLMAPLDTQAKELKKRADEAYSNGWHDDALEDYLNSEQKNKYDFSVHISIGMIYLFHLKNKEKALEYFDKAIKYAKPKSPYYTSYALLYKGLIMFDMGKLQEAINCCRDSIDTTNPAGQILESYYQCAQYNAQINNSSESLSLLEIVLKKDIKYFFKADKDKLFDPIRNDVNSLFNKLKLEEEKIALNNLSTIKQKIEQIEQILNELLNDKIITEHTLSFLFKNDLNKIKESFVNIKNNNSLTINYLKNDSYLDFYEINTALAPKTLRLIESIKGEFNKLFANISEKYNNLIYEKSESSNKEEKIYNINKSEANKSLSKYIKYYALFILPLLAGLVTAIMERGWSKLLSLFFLIPGISHIITIMYFFDTPKNEHEVLQLHIFRIVVVSAIIIPIIIYLYYITRYTSQLVDKQGNLSKQKKGLELTKQSLDSSIKYYDKKIKSI